jgi:hypothetical protein
MRVLGVHDQHERLLQLVPQEGCEALGQRNENLARLGRRCVHLIELEDGRGQLLRVAHAHGLDEEVLLAVRVTQYGGSSDAEALPDVGQSGRVVTLAQEGLPGSFHDVGSADACWTAHR